MVLSYFQLLVGPSSPYLIAGGKKALFSSIENAEDDIDEARRQVIDNKISLNDIVIELSAGGSTPFTNEVLRTSSKIGALTIGITNNEKTSLEKIFKILFGFRYWW